MGAANTRMVNASSKRLPVITFNEAELLYRSYESIYIIEPGKEEIVEANPAHTFKVGIIYEVDEEKKEFKYVRFSCKSGGKEHTKSFTIDEIDQESGEISWFASASGDVKQVEGKFTLKENDHQPWQLACEAIRGKKTALAKKNTRSPARTPNSSSANLVAQAGATTALPTAPASPTPAAASVAPAASGADTSDEGEAESSLPPTPPVMVAKSASTTTTAAAAVVEQQHQASTVVVTDDGEKTAEDKWKADLQRVKDQKETKKREEEDKIVNNATEKKHVPMSAETKKKNENKEKAERESEEARERILAKINKKSGGGGGGSGSGAAHGKSSNPASSSSSSSTSKTTTTSSAAREDTEEAGPPIADAQCACVIM